VGEGGGTGVAVGVGVVVGATAGVGVREGVVVGVGVAAGHVTEELTIFCGAARTLANMGARLTPSSPASSNRTSKFRTMGLA
jgi:hypothetical protein